MVLPAFLALLALTGVSLGGVSLGGVSLGGGNFRRVDRGYWGQVGFALSLAVVPAVAAQIWCADRLRLRLETREGRREE